MAPPLSLVCQVRQLPNLCAFSPGHELASVTPTEHGPITYCPWHENIPCGWPQHQWWQPWEGCLRRGCAGQLTEPSDDSILLGWLLRGALEEKRGKEWKGWVLVERRSTVHLLCSPHQQFLLWLILVKFLWLKLYFHLSLPDIFYLERKLKEKNRENKSYTNKRIIC